MKKQLILYMLCCDGLCSRNVGLISTKTSRETPLVTTIEEAKTRWDADIVHHCKAASRMLEHQRTCQLQDCTWKIWCGLAKSCTVCQHKIY
uniref:Uncharacterized protein n=1 Tax=Leersia perrieri TaxID=77586 RepID=A0A0D9XC23_9ORYZ